MHHLLSIIQASLEVAWLHVKECVNSDIFEPVIEFSKGILWISPEQWYGTTQWAVQEAFKPAMDIKESWKVYISWCVVSNRPSNLLKHFLLVTYPYMNDMISHQVFCCPQSVNTKRENQMVYGTSFMQCACTGYCESWILPLLSFIMNSW